MSKQEAVARLGVISTEVEALLEEAQTLCRRWTLTFSVEGVGTGYYRQNFRVDSSGDFEAWETSDDDWYASDSWDDSGC